MKNKEIEEVLEHLSATQKINNGWTSFSDKECKVLFNYIEQLENNRDKAIERCEFWLDFYRNVNNDERIILRLNDILIKLKGDDDE